MIHLQCSIHSLTRTSMKSYCITWRYSVEQ